MFLNPKIHEALFKAIILHQGQFRVDGKTPYIIHPLSVALTLREITNDEDTVVAGLLHDTVEDTVYSFEELEQDFGGRVRELVAGVTHNDDDLAIEDWRNAKVKEAEVLNSATEGVILIRWADALDNMRDVIYEYGRSGNKVWDLFTKSKEDKIWRWGQLQKIFNTRLDKHIATEYDKVYNQLKKLD